MKPLSGQSEVVEKERIRLQINAQVEEFLRRGGVIDVVTNHAKPNMAEVAHMGDDQEELTPLSK